MGKHRAYVVTVCYGECTDMPLQGGVLASLMVSVVRAVVCVYSSPFARFVPMSDKHFSTTGMAHWQLPPQDSDCLPEPCCRGMRDVRSIIVVRLLTRSSIFSYLIYMLLLCICIHSPAICSSWRRCLEERALDGVHVSSSSSPVNCP